jgi:biotin carboxylase
VTVITLSISVDDIRVPRILLILPTSTYRAPDFLDAARELGAEVVVASEEPQALAEAMGPRALWIDLCDPDEAASQIESLHVTASLDAIVAVDDRGVLAAAIAAGRLGLIHNPPEAVAATKDKTAMRARFASAGVPQPAFCVVTARDDLTAAVREVGLPCVVKPVTLSGSRGVIRADDVPGATAAAARVRSILAGAGEDPDGPLLVEAFAPGAEVAVEAILRGGELEVLAVFDKPDPLEGPYFEETIYVTPSRQPPDTQHSVREAVAAAAAALGLSEGPVHAEARVSGGRVTMLELAARSIGGLCSRTLRFGIGVSLEEVILRHALRLPLGRLQRTTGASGVMMLPIPRSGTLRAVHGRDEATAVEHISGLEITIPAGHAVRALPEGDRYLGFAFANAETPALVEDALREAHACLEIVIE